MKFEGVFEKGNNLFKLRLQQLDELINDDSLDWADPEEKIEDILEFMDEEKLKYEIAQELGVLDKVLEGGWKSLSAKETGRIGGLVASKRKENER